MFAVHGRLFCSCWWVPLIPIWLHKIYSKFFWYQILFTASQDCCAPFRVLWTVQVFQRSIAKVMHLSCSNVMKAWIHNLRWWTRDRFNPILKSPWIFLPDWIPHSLLHGEGTSPISICRNIGDKLKHVLNPIRTRLQVAQELPKFSMESFKGSVAGNHVSNPANKGCSA